VGGDQAQRRDNTHYYGGFILGKKEVLVWKRRQGESEEGAFTWLSLYVDTKLYEYLWVRIGLGFR